MADGLDGSAIEPLTARFDLKNFDCGDPALNRWLTERALRNQESDDTRCYVATDGDAVLGFHAVAVGSAVRSTIPPALRRNAPDPIGYVLLGQLAVDLRYQRRRLGRRLVVHAMQQAVAVARIAGCRLLAVHPRTSDLIDYYRQYEFEPVDASPPLMVMSMRKVRGILERVGERA